MKLVMAYIRVSGKTQVGGEGPDRQRGVIEAFCAGQAGLRGEFFDDISGEVEGMDRPAFAEMVTAIECSRLNGLDIEGFVIERADRLARNLMIGELILAECRKRNIKVFAADRGDWIDLATDDGDPTRKLIRQIMGALAEWEKSQIVRKLNSAKKAIKLRGGYCGGNVPYGAKEGEQMIIDYVRTLPPMSLTQLAKQLNIAGLKTRSGGQWQKESVRNLVNAVNK